MPPSSDLLSGRKAIMEHLQICNWEAVEKLVRKQGCPIAKLGGRWVSRRATLNAWVDKETGGDSMGEKPPSCTLSERSKAIWSRWRQDRMSVFLTHYEQCGCLVQRACKKAGINRQTFYNWRKEYPRFESACKSIEDGMNTGGAECLG